ncbi:hypothetical protein CCO03_18355 [Comamonas serinivorans]|uniref:AB hydrolase-1 domain-containing protein n=1 Tax=Comamonas serinivorans TaxID=1082851 RepID=A0A1Y0ESZ9_9BURK|nr:alpha/beta fold hydrolase [Comamonas serinivorans]ARU06362.1 hypothetical protein CCO03_18355 [Comamonas serinivorans]
MTPTSPIARRQRLLLALCGLSAVAGGVLGAHTPLLAAAWAFQALVGWWAGVLALQMALAQQGNRRAWRQHLQRRDGTGPRIAHTAQPQAAEATAATPASHAGSAPGAAPGAAQGGSASRMAPASAPSPSGTALGAPDPHDRQDPLHPATRLVAVRAWLWSCWAAPAVFFWRQPFREGRWPDLLPQATAGHAGAPQASRGAPDTPSGQPVRRDVPDMPDQRQAQRAVLFVHGFVSNRGFWNPWLQRLTAEGAPFMAVSLRQPFAPLDTQAAELSAAVDHVIATTGQPPLIVAHSMGGLVVRAWLRHEARSGLRWPDRVHRVALIATPIAGTGLARWALGPLGAQMRRAEDGGHWVTRLNADLDALAIPRQLFACWASNTDNMVFPAHTALLAGADSHVHRGVPHVPLAHHPAVMRAVLTLRHG